MSSIPALQLPLALVHLALQALLFAVSATQRSASPLPPPKMTGLCAARARGLVLCLSDRRTAATEGSCEPWHGGGEKAPVILLS